MQYPIIVTSDILVFVKKKIAFITGGCLDSVDWNDGMERWNGTVEWNGMEWNGTVEWNGMEWNGTNSETLPFPLKLVLRYRYCFPKRSRFNAIFNVGVA